MNFLRMLQCTLVSLAMLGAPVAQTQELSAQQLQQIDAHALAAPVSAEQDARQLAAYLTEGLSSEREKARAIYRWITDRINYDAAAYLSGHSDASTVEEVLRKRISVCVGFAGLFEQLARAAGLEARTISGYAKAAGSLPGQHFDKANHAWNAVRIDGQWRLIDTTWGAGYLKEGKFQKELSETFFLTAPEQLAFTHFPLDHQAQFQSTPHLSQAEFESLPALEANFFHSSISPLAVWSVLKNVQAEGGLVHTFTLPYHSVAVREAPLMYRLQREQAYSFRIEATLFEKMAIVQSDHWQEMQQQGASFVHELSSVWSGSLLVVGKPYGSEQYTAILAYELQ